MLPKILQNMFFWIIDDGLLQKYNKIWDKVSNIIKKGFSSEPVYNKNYLKTKVKFYEVKINTNFMMIECGKKVPTVFVYQ